MRVPTSDGRSFAVVIPTADRLTEVVYIGRKPLDHLLELAHQLTLSGSRGERKRSARA
jgi:hypothetical protein